MVIINHRHFEYLIYDIATRAHPYEFAVLDVRVTERTDVSRLLD